MFLMNQNKETMRGILITALVTGLFIIGADRVSAQKPSKTPAKPATPTAKPAPTPAKPTAPATGTAKVPTVKKNSIGLELVLIPAGSFLMGFAGGQTPQPKVAVDKEFWLGKYEVTQDEYQKVMGTNPSEFKPCPRCPVENVSWADADEFIKKLNAKNDDLTYRLPTDTEWEYAARAGTTTTFSFGDTLEPGQANFHKDLSVTTPTADYKAKTVAVGSYQPNAWGLFDMHGNVYEWVDGRYDKKYDTHFLRGGAWSKHSNEARTGASNEAGRTYKSNAIGFRIAAVIKK